MKELATKLLINIVCVIPVVVCFAVKFAHGLYQR